MNARIAILLMLLSMCSVSCVRTQALWDATDPYEYKEIPVEEINESELKESGRDYHRDPIVDVYHVEKSRSEKFRNYFVRIFIVPLCAILEPTIPFLSAAMAAL